MKKNQVFSTKPTQFNILGEETQAYKNHDPATPFTGLRVRKTGANAGETTPAYDLWVKQNLNKGDFNKPKIVGGKIATVKLGVNKDASRYRDNRNLRDIKLKPSIAKIAEFSNGILRPKPSSRTSFNYNYQTEDFVTQIKPYLKDKVGKFVLKWNGGNAEIDLTGNWKQEDSQTIWNAVNVTSSQSYFGYENQNAGRTDFQIDILEFKDVKFKPSYQGQIYADNKTGTCIIDPIYKHFSKQTTKTGMNTAKVLEKKIKKFPNGLSPDQIQKLCDAHKLHITIYHPVTGHPIVDLKTVHKCQKHFRYKNTRDNHAQGWKYCDLFDVPEDEIEYVDTEDDMAEIFKAQEGEFLYHSSQLIQGKSKISYINTPDKHYKLKNPLQEVTDEFYKQYPKLKKSLICDPDDVNDVNHFINQGTYVNGIHDYKLYDEKEPIYEFDIDKAYATFYKSDYHAKYQFPDTPTDFRNVEGQDIDMIIDKTGWTQIYNIKGSGNAFKLANLQEYGVYPNVELRCLKDINTTFDIMVSAWSVNTHDFRFGDDMLTSIEHDDYKRLKPYAIEAGKMLGFSKKKKVYYKYDTEPSQEWIDNMSFYDPDMSKLFNNTEEQYMIIQQRKKAIHHRNHIGSYITAYVRCRVYKEVEKIDNNDLWFVRSDAIKLKGDYPLPEGWKKVTKDINLHSDQYTSFMNTKNIQYDWDCGEYKNLDNKCIYSGAGGTGKTHSFIHDKGLVFKVLALPTNELKGGVEFKDKFTHHGVAELLIGDKKSNTQKFQNINCGNLFIDEITMRSKQDIKTLLELKGHRLIFAGDWDIKTGMVYQLKPQSGEFAYKEFKDLQVIPFTKNYRSKDKRLTQILTFMRKIMLVNYGRECLNDMNLEFTKILQEHKRSELFMFKSYQMDDLIICSLNKTQIAFNKVFDEENRLEKKWKITGKTDKYNRGSFQRGDIKTDQKELAFATTIHAVQGKTFTNKLYVDLGNIFEWGMFYTAVSRLTTLDDLYLID